MEGGFRSDKWKTAFVAETITQYQGSWKRFVDDTHWQEATESCVIFSRYQRNENLKNVIDSNPSSPDVAAQLEVNKLMCFVETGEAGKRRMEKDEKNFQRKYINFPSLFFA